MLPFGYDPKYYGGKIWWNENEPGMRAIWGTQNDYDKHIQAGGTWEQYEAIVMKKINALKLLSEEKEQQINNHKKK